MKLLGKTGVALRVTLRDVIFADAVGIWQKTRVVIWLFASIFCPGTGR